ncbi:hypothetical protein [Enterococcus rivorum]|uniref:hypothetical protein n=1 Tax=Enterococcus rivorum TaxID=762845 RepID=UPI000AC1A91A|nr:hypothetical protein [Enterococcus rivorum]MBP2097624.1 hypothetical protein [Enterococcus rivorum]
MEIPISQLGTLLKFYYEQGYFESESLTEAIEKLTNDQETTIGIAIQNEQDFEE